MWAQDPHSSESVLTITKHDTEIIGHNGETGGFHCAIGFNPEKKTGVVVLSNSKNDIDDIGFHILDPRYELQTVRKLVKIAPELLGDYVGKYQLRPGFIITVTTENEKLMVQATGQPKFEVYPETETKFFLTVVDAQITFLRDDNGEVNRLMLHQGGAELVGKKLAPGEEPPETVREEIEIDPAILDDYVGKYQLQGSAVFHVTKEDDSLMVQLTGQEKYPVYPESEVKFFYKIVDAQITFLKDNNGNVDRLMLNQSGQELIAPKIGVVSDY